MRIETQKLLIRDVKTEDEIPFVKMAADGSLNDCGFDSDCSSWIKEWLTEARDFAVRDNPDMDYLAYTITLKDEIVDVCQYITCLKCLAGCRYPITYSRM